MEKAFIFMLLLKTAGRKLQRSIKVSTLTKTENATAVSHSQIHPRLLTNLIARGPAQQHQTRLVEALDI